MSAETAYPASEAQAPRWRFEVLESCRGFLAVTVIFYHLNAATHFYAFFHNAYVAVDFFFVLSGFVIASVYEDRIRSLGQLIQYGVRRVGRLVPLHVFVMLVWLAIEFWKLNYGQEPAFTGETSWEGFWSVLTLTQAWGPHELDWNYPSWSIGVELWTSLFAGLLILICGRRTWLGAAVAGLALVAFFFSEAFVDYGGLAERMEILFNRADYMIGFFLGMLTWSLFKQARKLRLGAFWGLDILALGLVVAMFLYGPDMPPLTKTLVFAFAVMVFAFEKGPVCALLRAPACLRLGTISYSIYLTHTLFVGLATTLIYLFADHYGLQVTDPNGQKNVIVLGGTWVLDALALSVVALVIASSNLTYRFIEDPARRFFNRLSGAGSSRT